MQRRLGLSLEAGMWAGIMDAAISSTLGTVPIWKRAALVALDGFLCNAVDEHVWLLCGRLLG